jgi:hypothetical protein
MDLDQILRASGLDRYDRNARLYPAFLSLMPILIVVALWLPQVWTLLGGFLSFAVACGLIFYLAQVVRYLGRKVEKRLGDRVARPLSAILLSHMDTRIPSDTKARYHQYLSDHGIRVPDLDLELKDPASARQGFRSAVDWLLEHTRPAAKASMLLNENIAYGFRRNLLGLKPVAILLLFSAITANAVLVLLHHHDQDRALAAGIVEALFLLALVAWVWIVNSAFVEDASFAYAQRFLAQCERAQPAKKPRRARARPTASDLKP